MKKWKPRKTMSDTWIALSLLVNESDKISKRIKKDSERYVTRTDKFVGAILRNKPKPRSKPRSRTKVA